MQNKLILARRRRIFLRFYSAKQVDFSPPQAVFLGVLQCIKMKKTIDFSPPQAENFRGLLSIKQKTVDFSPPQAKKNALISPKS